jgi:hypothetical protein
MSVKEITEKTYLVIDNSVLSMITEWYCYENHGLSCQALLEQTHQLIHNQIEVFQLFAVDGVLHTSTSVSDEYKPWHENGGLRKRGIEILKIQTMAKNICSKFSTHEVDTPKTNFLRTLPTVDPRLVKKLTDQDLSLVHVGLSLSCSNQKVYILTNDQDLLSYISWARTQKSLRNGVINPQLLQGLSGITFMDLVHRQCFISSDQMLKMIGYLICETNDRMLQNDPMALGKEKGTKIITDATKMLGSALLESMKIKLQKQGATV